MPDEVSAIIEIVPVGAMLNTVAFLFGLFILLFLILGNEPRFFASSCEALSASFLMNLITCSAVFNALFESYFIPNRINISVRPITPKPIFLFAMVILAVSFTGYLFASITLSKKCTPIRVNLLNFSQLILLLSIIFDKLIEPKLQDSYGNKSTSPQGFVDSILPNLGVGCFLFISSMKTIPGSPLRHAIVVISSNKFLALILYSFFPEWGLTS